MNNMDDPLTKRRYYQYSHHPDFVEKKAEKQLLWKKSEVGRNGTDLLYLVLLLGWLCIVWDR